MRSAEAVLQGHRARSQRAEARRANALEKTYLRCDAVLQGYRARGPAAEARRADALEVPEVRNADALLQGHRARGPRLRSADALEVLEVRSDATPTDGAGDKSKADCAGPLFKKPTTISTSSRWRRKSQAKATLEKSLGGAQAARPTRPEEPFEKSVSQRRLLPSQIGTQPWSFRRVGRGPHKSRRSARLRRLRRCLLPSICGRRRPRPRLWCLGKKAPTARSGVGTGGDQLVAPRHLPFLVVLPCELVREICEWSFFLLKQKLTIPSDS